MIIYIHVQLLKPKVHVYEDIDFTYKLTEDNTYEFLSSFCTFMNHVLRNNTFHNVWPVGELTVKLLTMTKNRLLYTMYSIYHSKINLNTWIQLDLVTTAILMDKESDHHGGVL